MGGSILKGDGDPVSVPKTLGAGAAGDDNGPSSQFEGNMEELGQLCSNVIADRPIVEKRLGISSKDFDCGYKKDKLLVIVILR